MHIYLINKYPINHLYFKFSYLIAIFRSGKTTYVWRMKGESRFHWRQLFISVNLNLSLSLQEKEQITKSPSPNWTNMFNLPVLNSQYQILSFFFFLQSGFCGLLTRKKKSEISFLITVQILSLCSPKYFLTCKFLQHIFTCQSNFINYLSSNPSLFTLNKF